MDQGVHVGRSYLSSDGAGSSLARSQKVSYTKCIFSGGVSLMTRRGKEENTGLWSGDVVTLA